MMAEYDDDDEQDILHIDDITKLYSQNMVSKILFVKIILLHGKYILMIFLFFRMKHKNQTIF